MFFVQFNGGFVLLLFLSLILFVAAEVKIQEQIRSLHVDPQRLKTHEEYLSLRNNCTWKQWRDRVYCSGYRMDCEISDVKLEEGTGLLQISRFGPFVTRGGMQDVMCMESTLVPPRGSWLKSYTVQIIDPYSEETMTFPPIHLHHAVPFRDMYAPNIDKKKLTMLPFLSQGRPLTKPFISPSAAADTEVYPYLRLF